MKRKRGWLLYPLIVLVLVLSAIPAYADTPMDLPAIPHPFYGTVTIGGSDAPVGTVVTAKVGGVQCGSITTTVAGQYGGSGAFDDKLSVTGDIETGATISFFVDGVDTTQTYPFSPGADPTELDLTAEPPDTTPPTVSITALTPDPTNDNTPTFTGTATDTLSNISSVEYRVDDGSWTAATASDGVFDSPSEGYTFTTTALSDGAHTVYVRATDAATNTTAEADYASDSFTVDTTGPSVTITPLTPDPTNDNTPTFTGTATDTLSNISSVEYRVDAGSWTAATASDGAFDSLSEGYTFTTAALSDGAHTVYVRATDSVATPNMTAEADYATDSFTVDATAPSVTITALTPDPTNDNTPTFTGTATDTLSNISSVEYRVDAGSWIAATASDGAFDSLSEGYTFTTAALSDGAHTVYVRATDSVATPNTTAEADYASDSFTVIPTGAPSVTSTSPGANATDVAVDTTVSAVFGKDMDPSTITASSFTLTGSVVSGTVTYNSSTKTATFTPDANLAAGTTYTATLSPAITSVVPGDVNGDGNVNALDITKVERIIAGLDAETLGADANEDGNINALDITKVERIIAGLDVTAGTPLAAEYSWSFTTVQ